MINKNLKGDLVTFNNVNENFAARDHMNELNTESGTTWYAWAFIGLRRSCRDCPRFSLYGIIYTWTKNYQKMFNWYLRYWEDQEPVTFTNWYGNEPISSTSDCTHMRTAAPYDGSWVTMACHAVYHGVCQFFPKVWKKLEFLNVMNIWKIFFSNCF